MTINPESKTNKRLLTPKITRRSVLGHEWIEVCLCCEDLRITINNLGCTINAIEMPDRNGVVKNIVAAYPLPEQYFQNEYYLGCVIGRYANRIREGAFTLDGKKIRLTANDGPHHLHGGNEGFHKKFWKLDEVIESEEHLGVAFSYLSKDGEEGYPGNLEVKVTYLLDNQNRLTVHYHAKTDQRVPVNLTNHSYFNLSGFREPTISHHRLCVHAVAYTENNSEHLPTGKIIQLDGTFLDLRKSKELGQVISELNNQKGLNHNFILAGQIGQLRPAAELTDPESGRSLRVLTDLPAIQVYTAGYWDGTIPGSHGAMFYQYGAIALETQAYPDSPNQDTFPNTILDPSETYQTTTVYEFYCH